MPYTVEDIRQDIGEQAEKISWEILEKTKNIFRQKNVDDVADSLGAAVVQRENMPGMMFVEENPPRIEGPVISDQKDYMVMLHELGHVSYGHTQGRPPFVNETYYFDNGVLRSECEAWRFAMETCFEELTDETRMYMWNTCLGSYYSGAMASAGRGGQAIGNGNRHHVRFAFDKPDDFFWRTVQMILGFLPDVTGYVEWSDGSLVTRRTSYVSREEIAARA